MPITKTPDQLDKLAEVSESDIEDARLAWRRDAPPALRGLLDATPVEPPPPKRRGRSEK